MHIWAGLAEDWQSLQTSQFAILSDVRLNLRNANISALVGAIILFPGVFIFRHAGEDVLQLVLVVSWVAMFGTLIYLDRQEERRKRRGQ